MVSGAGPRLAAPAVLAGIVVPSPVMGGSTGSLPNWDRAFREIFIDLLEIGPMKVRNVPTLIKSPSLSGMPP